MYMSYFLSERYLIIKKEVKYQWLERYFIIKKEIFLNLYKLNQLLQLKSIARIDFMVVNNIPYVIEVNTTPGFAPASIAPQMISCAGKSIKEFWTEIIEEELKN